MESCKLAFSVVRGAMLNTYGNTLEETKVYRDFRQSLLRKVSCATMVAQFFALSLTLSGCGIKNKGDDPTYSTTETLPKGLGTYYYKIGYGDNLTFIAKGFGITISEILNNNPQIIDESVIAVGDVLYLPVVEKVPDKSSKLMGEISRDGVHFENLTSVPSEPKETEPKETKPVENDNADYVSNDWDEKLEKNGYVKGIDISNAGQSRMNLNSVLQKNSEIDFVMVRAGYFVLNGASRGLDKKFLEFAKVCRDNNKPMGIYYWPSFFDKEEANKETELILNSLAELKDEYGLKLEMPIALDIELEIDGGGTVVERILNEDPDTLEAIETTINNLSEAGYYVSIYIGNNALRSYPKLREFVQSLDLDTWIPKYANSNATYIESKPAISDVSYDGFVGIKQYSQTGVLKGYDGYVDLDVAFVNYPKIMREKQLGGFDEDSRTLSFHN